MIIKSFECENFRNIKRAKIDFSEGVNLLIGDNAQGKTNVAEGINIFSLGKSFRSQDDKELVKFGEDGFYISISYIDNEGEGKLEYSFYKKERRRKKNGIKIDRISDMLGNFRSVLFFPDNMSIVKGGPEERRSFLNSAISQCYPEYVRNYHYYKNALENRNCLLKLSSKGMPIDINEIMAWSDRLSEYAAYIYMSRKEYIERLSAFAKKIMKEISDSSEELELVFKSDIEGVCDSHGSAYGEYKRIFTSQVEHEMLTGTSLFGPHRDNIEIYINGKSARAYASQGQKRSIVLALKLAEGEVIKELFGEYPVYILDDVLSELDEKRKKYLLEGIREKQIIITSCEDERENIRADNIIKVSRGEYVSTHR